MNAQLERTTTHVIDPEVGTQYGVLPSSVDDPFLLHYIVIPRWQAPTLRNYSQMANDVKQWTDWSLRTFAQVLGTTHPTMRQILDAVPGSGARHPDLLRRLERVYDVVARVYQLTGRDSQKTAAILLTKAGPHSAMEYLVAGETNKVYLAAIEAIRPRERNDLLSGSRPMQPGQGTIDYLATE